MKNIVVAALLLGGPAVAGPLPAPLTAADFPSQNADLVLLGRDLFFDPILSGNKNISCATCHNPTLGTGDAVSLGIGEGGFGLGPARQIDDINTPLRRIARNAQPLFNLGANDVRVLFHDGRVELDDTIPGGVRMPEGKILERAVPNILTAQAMLPVLNPDQMAGHPGENDVADAVAEDMILGEGGAWDILADRVAAVPEYRRRFDWILGTGKRLHFIDIATAIAAYESFEFRTTDSAFDRHLTGEEPLTGAARRGMDLFYGNAGCDTCHAGSNLTDQQFYSIALPQIGPGMSPPDMPAYADPGRWLVTGVDEDKYRFRTPGLRNVALTGPYGHSGAYADLEDMLRHHVDPIGMLEEYDPESALLNPALQADDFGALADVTEIRRIAESNTLFPADLTERDIADLVAFLESLTDETALGERSGIPMSVPSGLLLDPSG